MKTKSLEEIAAMLAERLEVNKKRYERAVDAGDTSMPLWVLWISVDEQALKEYKKYVSAQRKRGKK